MAELPPGFKIVKKAETLPPGFKIVKPDQEDSNKQFYDDTAIGEFGEGLVSGIIGIGEGVAQVASLPSDIIYGTNFGDKVTEGAENLRNALGLDPEGLVGKGTEIITQFVVPGVGGAKVASWGMKFARGGKKATTIAERFTDAAAQIGAAGAVDALVATDSLTTIGDWVNMGPTQTEDLVGLEGREKALARFRNKLRVGAEAVGVGAAVSGVVEGVTRSPIGEAIGRGVQPLAKAASDKLNQAGESIDNLLYRRMTAKPTDGISTFGEKIADGISYFRYRGYLPKDAAEQRLRIDGKIQKDVKEANFILKDFEKKLDGVMEKLPQDSNLDKVEVMNRLENYLTENIQGLTDPKLKPSLKDLPTELQGDAIKMRHLMDKLSTRILNSKYLTENDFRFKDGSKLLDVMRDGVNSYIRKRYRVFEDAKYAPTEEVRKGAREFFKRNKKTALSELNHLARKDNPLDPILTDDFLARNNLKKEQVAVSLREMKDQINFTSPSSKVSEEVADVLQASFLDKYKVRGGGKVAGGRVAENRLDTGLFAARKENIPKELKRLLGEIEDPREAFLGTVADLSQYAAVDEYFNTLASMANQRTGLGKLFIKPGQLTPDQEKNLLDNGKFVRLGKDVKAYTEGQQQELANVTLGKVDKRVVTSGKVEKRVEDLLGDGGWGQLDGYIVPERIYNNLTQQIYAETDAGPKVARALLGTFLKAKGISQYSKTILSPITQVRNAVTATAFALANGNVPVVGRGGSIRDSMKIVFANIRNQGDEAIRADIQDAYNRGIFGTNAELKEIQDILNKGLTFGQTGKRPQNFAESILTKTGGRGEKLVKKVGKPMSVLEDIYQGSDDGWKYFAYHAEQAKLRDMMSGLTNAQKINHLTKNGTDLPEEVLTKLREGTYKVDDLIKDRAAQIVRDTVPNYNKAASEAVKFGRKLPVGNFITFPAEILRTGFNIIRQSLDEMASDIPSVQMRGRQRMAGFVGTTVMLPKSLSIFATGATCVSQEEMQAIRRSSGAPWEKGAILIPVSRDKDGTIHYINFSTSNPYDTLYRAAVRAMAEMDEAKREGKTMDQLVGDVALNSMKEFFAPFMDEAMLSSALIDIGFRGGRTETGAEVFNPEDPLLPKTFKKVMHVAETLMPNLVPLNVSGGELEPSRFLRGTLGNLAPSIVNPKDKLGRERSFAAEISRQMTGFSTQEFNPTRNLGFAARALQRRRTDAKRMFNKKTDDANITAQGLIDGFKEANNAKLISDRAFYQLYEDFKTLNLSDGDIRRALKKAQIGGFKDIARGEFMPFDVSKDNMKKMRDAGVMDQFNAARESIREIQKQMRGTSLIPDDEDQSEVPASTLPPGFKILDNQTSSLPPGFKTLGNQTPTTQPPINMNFAGNTQAPMDPSLLGNNPLNVQIAQRLNRV